MRYVKIDKGSVIYPYTISQLYGENPNVSFPREMADELLAEYSVFRVANSNQPEVTYRQRVVEGTPALLDGVWTQQWDIVPAEVPQQVSAAQIRLFLESQGLLESVEKQIATMSKAVQIEWEYRTEFRRDNPLLKEVAETMKLTDEMIDEFFFQASML